MSTSSKISVGPLELELEFSTAKILGVAGALLSIVIVGVGLLLISLNYFSKLYRNPSIYKSYLYAGVLLLSSLFIGLFMDFWISIIFNPNPINPGNPAAGVSLGYLVVRTIASLIEALVFMVAMLFYYRALTPMAAGSQVELFKYAGLSGLVAGGLRILGALLLVVAGDFFEALGFLALIVSYILLLVAFLQLEEPQSSPSPQPIAPAAPA